MKTICTLLFSIFLCQIALAQASYLARIKNTPSTMSSEAVSAYISSLDSLQDEVKEKSSLYKKENDAAINSIDQTKLAQYYMNKSQNITVDEVQEMQKSQETTIALQKKLNDLMTYFSAKKDSIDMLYSTDITAFNKEFDNYMSKCSGEVGSVNQCDGLFASLNASRTKFLNKYFFGPGALYVAFLNEFRSAMPPVAVSAGVNAIESSEKTLPGVTFPHKEDLCYCEVTNDIIIEIKDVFVIDYKLWPSK